MPCSRPCFDDRAARCLRVAKHAATQEGAARLSARHVLRAAATLHPDLVARSGLDEALIARLRLDSWEDPALPRMALDDDLRSLVFGGQLHRGDGGPITVENLIPRLVMIQSAALPYRFLSEELEDAGRRLGLACRVVASGEDPARDAVALESLRKLDARIWRRSEDSEGGRPLARVFPECEREELSVLLCIAAWELFGPAETPTLRILLRLREPSSGWLRACRRFVDAAKALANRSLIETATEPPNFGVAVRLAAEASDRIFKHLESEPLRTNELEEMKAQLNELT